jgi:glycolate dehydrogenase FAD-binding subunit
VSAFSFEGCEIEGCVRPKSREELAAILGELAARGGAALVRGGGSRLGVGNALRRADLVLETGGLDRLLELDADEGVLQAEAGAPLAALRRAAAEAGWELPLDPPGEAATLGGALAAAAAGPCFPAPRDALLGIEVALASGERVRAGGRVVKNVTGYDLGKLFTGSFGALGVIVSAWVRLRPRPEARAVLVAALPSDASRTLEASRRPTVRAAIVLDAPLAGQALPGADGARLLLEIAGDEPAVAGERAWLGGALGAEDAPPEALERTRALLGEAPAEGLSVRVATLPTAAPAAASALRGAGAAVLAEPARGLVRAWAPLPAGAPHPGAEPLLAAAREAAVQGRGSWRVETAPLAVKRSLDVFGDPGPRLALLRRLKAEYDPGGALNPGRFAGRL